MNVDPGRRRRLFLPRVTAVGLGALLTAGCFGEERGESSGAQQGGDSGQGNAFVECKVVNPEEWMDDPGEHFGVAALAYELGVSESQMRRGDFGIVECERLVTPQDVIGGLQTNIDGRPCQVVGSRKDTPSDLPLDFDPYAPVPTRFVLAVCAAPPSG